VKISDTASDADQQVIIPRAYDEIGVGNHPFHTVSIVNWPTLPKRRTLQQTDELISGNGLIHPEADSHTSPWQLTPAINGALTRASGGGQRPERI
jgi:hypothetical protein